MCRDVDVADGRVEPSVLMDRLQNYRGVITRFFHAGRLGQPVPAVVSGRRDPGGALPDLGDHGGRVDTDREVMKRRRC